MAEYLSPGVYVEEFDSGIKPMEGVSTSTAGFIGMTQRGAISGVPEFVGSYGEFQRKFGGYLPKSKYGDRRFLPMAVEQFFNNGGTRCFVVRLLDPSYAKVAEIKVGKIIFKAKSPGDWGNDVVLTCAKNPMGANIWNIQVICLDSKGKPFQQEAFAEVTMDPASDNYLLRVLEKSLLITAEYDAQDGKIPDLLAEFAAVDAREVKDANLPLVRLVGGCDFAKDETPNEKTNPDLTKGTGDSPGDRTGLHAFKKLGDTITIKAKIPGARGNDITVTCSQNQTVTSSWDIQVTCPDAEGGSPKTESFKGAVMDSNSSNYLCTMLKTSTLITVEHAAKADDDIDLLALFVDGDERGAEAKDANLPLVKLAGGRDPSASKTQDKNDATETPKKTGGGTGLQALKKLGDTITIKAESPGVWGNSVVITCTKNATNNNTWDIKVTCPDAKGDSPKEESFEGVTMDSSSDKYICTVFKESKLITVEYNAQAGATPDLFAIFVAKDDQEPKNANLPLVKLAGGCDPAPTPASDGAATLLKTIDSALLKGTDGGPGNRTGLQAFRDVPGISIMVAPGMVEPAEIMEVVNHCEQMENRVCILDIKHDMNSVTELQAHRTNLDSSFAALYHPWIQVFDPLEKKPVYMPPSGAIAGIYARTDSTRGVHKAPANENIRSCTGLEILFGKPEQDMLNPVGVNLIRNIQGQGIRVWGARTCSNDPSWKYVNVRRLFIYIEETIRNSTGWAVFEPNDQTLWTKIRGTITSFLNTLWRNGMLAGGGEGDSFFVNIGKGSTMTDDDILNGRLICVIGVAPVRPAEFVIFRITQIMETNS